MNKFKNLSRLILMCVIASCSNDSEINNELGLTADGKMLISGHLESVESVAGSRTILNGDGAIWWKPADEIKLYFGADSATFQASNVQNSACANFVGDGSKMAGNYDGYWAVYPSANAKGFTGTTVNVVLPSEQQAVAESFADDLFVSIAKSSECKEFSFYNLCGGVCFKLGESGVEKIVFRGNDGEKLSGEFAVTVSDENIPTVSTVVNGATQVVLNGEFAADTWYYIVTVPTTLSKGYTLSLYKGEEVAVVNSEEQLQINRSAFTPLTLTELNFQKQWDSYSKVWSEWPEYQNAPYYNFEEINGGKEWLEPTKNVPMERLFANDEDLANGMVVSDRRWVFVGGPVRRSTVTLEAVNPMLEMFNEQFSFLRQEMGWPPITSEIDGYRNMILLHQSGLIGQGRDTTAQGGWQSGAAGYPVVLLSYVPVCAFNPKTYDSWQTGASIHEGVHAVFAGMPGCKWNSAWFHEGANTWLQAQLNIEMAIAKGEATYEQISESGEYGWLCMSSVCCPFMPIECYSGWLTTDNSFGGPSAQGNIDGNCTRAIIGGSQYSSVFPSFMSIAMSKYSVAQIWAEESNKEVVARIADFLGDEQTRRLVMEYRARLCMADFEEWSGAVKKLMDNNWGSKILPERTQYEGTQKAWTSYIYAKTTIDADGWYRPDDYTLPGWTGANIIPFIVDKDRVAFKFEEVYEGAPLYEGEHNAPGRNIFREDGDTRFMICWRGTDGTPYYTEAVGHGGELVVDLTGKTPANNCIFVVACNTDYLWYEEIRKAKYDYKVKPLYGVAKAAAISKKWYEWNKSIK